MSNEELAIRHIESVTLSFVEKQREELRILEDHNYVLSFDIFKVQTTEKFLNYLEENNLVHVGVPPNLTHKFQPLGSNINTFAKSL